MTTGNHTTTTLDILDPGPLSAHMVAVERKPPPGQPRHPVAGKMMQLPRHQWDDMGNPPSITITITPGDTPNP